MELYRQGYSECFLATVAMLARTPMAQLKRELRARFGISYTDYRLGRLWKFPAGKGCPDVRTWFCAKAGLDVEAVRGWWYRDRSALVPGSDPVVPDLTGEGMVVVEWNEEKAPHAMAYKDGVIYDGNAPAPLPVSAWVEQRLPHYGKTIKKMTAFPKEKP